MMRFDNSIPSGDGPARPAAARAVDAAREIWRGEITPSLPEVYRTLHVPETGSFLRKMMAFAGPGFLVSVGYMDPGNWATDLAGGSKYSYSLLSVILISNLMAVLLQSLCVKLGLATGRDLAQACRERYS